ncbi:MAG: cation diffusion facilitator family transporter [Gammaproteobacteria bacterium]|nr:cation diffusion facilitator family transporter [Gammaproteobacteria bacterium]
MSASSSKKVIFAALIGNGLITITKFIAAGLTNSSAMLSEGIHSLVDTGNQVLLLHGMRQSQKPPDEKFPFGHGKEIYFWAFAVAILIFAVGAGVSIYEGVHHILDPTPMKSPHVNYIVLGLSILFEGAAWYFAFKEFSKTKGNWGYVEAVKRGKDPSMFVVLFEDSAAMLGLLIALAGVGLSQYTGNPVYDGIASVMIGMVLGGTAIWLAYETKSLLIGESANPEVKNEIKRILNSESSIKSTNEILTMHMGPEFILVNISVDFRDDIPIGTIEKTIADIDRKIKSKVPEAKRIFVEAEAGKGY